MAAAKVEGTVFEPLGNPAELAEAQTVLGASVAEGRRPDAMYDAIRERGARVLDSKPGGPVGR